MDRHIRAVDRRDCSLRDYLGDGVYAAHDGFGIWVGVYGKHFAAALKRKA